MGAGGPVGVTVRVAGEGRADALGDLDPVAAERGSGRRESIRRWCAVGSVLVAEDVSGPLGYCVVEYTFFEQGFVPMVMVAPGARGRGVGRLLLDAAATACTTPKLFTSTNLSNQPMHRLLLRAGWSPAGLVHGLDEGDPEVFYLHGPLAGG
ncbi:GNAT family N-acetyltransferase [Streptomyces sp. NPDC051784]|uniref:GNAT family N-acetyltransferase n=1 Tax=Streptomyces sp. NPDC051784 TaxID=3155805 RepID=UPI00342C1633